MMQQQIFSGVISEDSHDNLLKSNSNPFNSEKMNTKLLKMIFGLGSITAVIIFTVFYLRAEENEERDDLYRKIMASEASAFGYLNKDGSADMQPLDAEMVAFWNHKLHNSTRITSKSSLLKFNQFYLGFLELTNKHNHEKLNVEVIVPHENKDVKFENLECQILYRIKGKEKSLLLFTEAVR